MKTVKAEVTWTYYKNGQLMSEEYCIDGKQHNENGPAYKSWDDENGQLMSEAYCIDGKRITKEQFDKRNTISCSCEGKVVEIDGKKYQLKEI